MSGETFNWRSGILECGYARNDRIRWLCWICCREVQVGHVPWVSRACRRCWNVNAGAGELLGGKRIWPLGLYSLMNGVGITISPGADVDDAQIERFQQQFTAMTSMVDTLDRWGASERKRMGTRARLTEPRVEVVWWTTRFPSSPRASASAFARLMRTHLPSVVEIEPRVADVAWLTEAAHEV